jgi:hypothetical protein
MPSRSVRRRHHKHLAALRFLTPARRQAEASRRLAAWRAEARRRADDLAAPAVWALAAAARPAALVLDPGGELAADLDRLCAETLADVAGGHLVRGSRPAADRDRRHGPA